MLHERAFQRSAYTHTRIHNGQQLPKLYIRIDATVLYALYAQETSLYGHSSIKSPTRAFLLAATREMLDSLTQPSEQVLLSR